MRGKRGCQTQRDCSASESGHGSALQRHVLQVFGKASSRFAIYLRPEEIEEDLASADLDESINSDRVQSTLDGLCHQSYLTAFPDIIDAATLKDFYQRRCLYQLTAKGEAAARSNTTITKPVNEAGRFHVGLSKIHELLEDLARIAAVEDPDGENIHRNLTELWQQFATLTAAAHDFVSMLQRAIDLHALGVEGFLKYKQRLLEHLETTLQDLVIGTSEIANAIHRVEKSDIDRLFQAAAQQQTEVRSASAPCETTTQHHTELWNGLRRWFLSEPASASYAEVLRARACSAVTALLDSVAMIHDRRMLDGDRSADYRTLARWFAQTDSDQQAHRLWRAAFGLTSARHLSIDPETLQQRDANPISADTSWLSARPQSFRPRLRKPGRGDVQPSEAVIDRSREKALLDEHSSTQADQIADATKRLATSRPLRLSEVGELDATEFNLFLEVLGAGLTASRNPNEQFEAASNDGTLQITLQPTDDDATATIRTNAGQFSGRDYLIQIRTASDDDAATARVVGSETADSHH